MATSQAKTTTPIRLLWIVKNAKNRDGMKTPALARVIA
jgi:hypothetical protein